MRSLGDLEREVPRIENVSPETTLVADANGGPAEQLEEGVAAIPQPAMASVPPPTATAPVSPRPAHDRKITLYAPPSASAPKPSPNLPEGYYEMEPGEFRAHWAAGQARTKALLEAPLVSRVKLRERQQRELLEKHPATVLRFRFPDQYILEASFGSTETVTNLFAFVDSVLTSLWPFALSIGPPPQSLIRADKTPLWRHDLVPAAIVNLTWADGSGSRSSKTLDLLQPEVGSALTQSPPSLPTTGEAVSTSLVEAASSGQERSETSNRPSSGPLPNPHHPASVLKKPSWLRL